jgi:WD40 repeat protein
MRYSLLRVAATIVVGLFALACTTATGPGLADGRVLAAGGDDGSGPLRSAELYDSGSGSWNPTRSMVTPRQAQTATLLPDGRVLLSAGDNTTRQSAELYEPSIGSWTVTGSMAEARFNLGHAATLLPDGSVLVAGGGGDGMLTFAELYDPASGSWTATPRMTETRIGHTATLLPDGTVLVAGGFNGLALTLASAELYIP